MLIGGALGSLFGGDDKKKDPFEWYKQHPETIPEALAKDRDPRSYAKQRYLWDLLDKYEQATQEANIANERRYQQLLQESSRLEELYRGQKYVPMDFDDYDYGEAAKKEVEEQRRYGQAESLAALQRQGLGGSTVVGSILLGGKNVWLLKRVNLRDLLRHVRAKWVLWKEKLILAPIHSFYSKCFNLPLPSPKCSGFLLPDVEHD